MKKIFFLILISIIAISAYTQESGKPDESHESDKPDNNIYIINNIDFDITGRTKPYAIRQKIDLTLGEELTGLSNLERYIQIKKEDLNNQRVLESTNIDYIIEEPREDGKYPVNLLITTVDTWNIIPMPYPKYDTNTGFELILKVRDYNFLGTLNALRIDLGYKNDENNLNFYNIMAETEIPFELFSLFWNTIFYNNIEFRPDMSTPWHFYHTIGLSVFLPVKSTTMEIGIKESFIANQEIEDKFKDIYGDVHNGFYFSTNPFIFWEIPTGLEIFKYGELVYSPKINAVFNHEIREFPLPHDKIGPWITFDHKLKFGRINWMDNFREGMSAHISNFFTYDFYEKSINGEPLYYGIEAGTQIHKPFINRLAIYTRLLYRHRFYTEYEEAGDVLRGVVDKDISADIMLSLNLDLALGILKFRPSEWFDSSKLRFFDFDLIISPFIDMAVFRSPEFENKYRDESFSYKNLITCAGLEVTLFPRFMRSLFLRGSLGINMSTITGLKSNEIFIGTELHY